MLTDVLTLWEDLSTESREAGEYLERLVRPDAEVEVVLGKGPKQCNLIIFAEFDDGWDQMVRVPNCMNCKLILEKNTKKLALRLKDLSLEEIFIWFSQDVANRLHSCTIAEASSILQEALLQWSEAFSIKSEKGMSKEAQQGLFAELFYLDEMFFRENSEHGVWPWNSQNCIHDFQIEDQAWEIKSYGGRRPEVIISNEQQLDTIGLKKLYLVVLALKVSEEAGYCVESLVKKLIERIGKDASQLLHFRTGLAKYGYIDRSSITKQYYFSPKSLSEFEVKDQFPRITRADISKAVHSVKYILSIGLLDEFLVRPVIEYQM